MRIIIEKATIKMKNLLKYILLLIYVASMLLVGKIPDWTAYLRINLLPW